MEHEELLTTVKNTLQTAPAYWGMLVNRYPADLLNRKPAPGEWSAMECLMHLVDTEAVFQARIQAFLEGRDFPAFNPDAEGTKPTEPPTPAELVAEFVTRRQVGLQTLADLTPKDLDRGARHQELGPVTLSQMIHEWVAHDLNHIMQAERALMQPFLLGCGPWIKYFRDHTYQA